ncbi:MAG: formimidoylglutamase [Pseudobacter sp.]|uniref:formimidoylglutamase n=1 Tax=Pseudobacter sp. TaxID=2045420 RepID=UPI003F81A825
MKNFQFYDKEEILKLTKIRRFETKLGECVQVLRDDTTWERALEENKAKYVLFGIPENIGVKANYGIGGTESVWPAFLRSFLNIQSNDFFIGDEILLLGQFDFGDLHQLIESNAHDEEERINAYRHAVTTIDDAVESLVKVITAQNKIPIAIGGGHNNAYPMLKGSAKGLHKAGIIPLAQINCVNLDAHSDYRPAEGRHSGNGFRYAEEDGYIQKYCMVALHENYLPQNVWMDIVNNPFLDCITYEDIFIRQKRTFVQALGEALDFMEDQPTGVELDLDSIEGVLSSAATPAGLSSLHARQYVSLFAASGKPAYLHICEGATRLEDGRKDESTGKLVSYLVSDFVKG